MNVKAAEAERNCDLGEILVANSRKSDEQNGKALMEADVDDSDQMDPLETECETEFLESEMVVIPDDNEDNVTEVENFEDLGDEVNAN